MFGGLHQLKAKIQQEARENPTFGYYPNEKIVSVPLPKKVLTVEEIIQIVKDYIGESFTMEALDPKSGVGATLIGLEGRVIAHNRKFEKK